MGRRGPSGLLSRCALPAQELPSRPPARFRFTLLSLVQGSLPAGPGCLEGQVGRPGCLQGSLPFSEKLWHQKHSKLSFCGLHRPHWRKES